MSAHAHLVSTYLRLRKIGMSLNHKLSGSLGKEDIEESARTLGMFKKGTVVFGTEDEVAVLMDYCINDFYKGGRNAVQRMLDEAPPSNPDELALLRAQTQAWYSIFQVVEVERGAGVLIEDTLRGGTHFMVDVSMGNSSRAGYLMAGRVIPLDSFVMSGGALLPVAGLGAQRLARVLERRLARHRDFARMTAAEQSDLAATVIRTCLEAGASEYVSYATPGEGKKYRNSPGPEPVQVRANRNDPCPCGSGRKYKSCCGKR
jgi:SEC-C motif